MKDTTLFQCQISEEAGCTSSERWRIGFPTSVPGMLFTGISMIIARLVLRDMEMRRWLSRKLVLDRINFVDDSGWFAATVGAFTSQEPWCR